MNHAISGKPGDGKGLFSMRLVYHDITRTWRPIITDLAVEKLPWVTGSHQPRRGFTDYLLDKHHKTFEMQDRVFRLKPKAMVNFFLYRALNRQQVERLGAAHLIGYREVTPLDDVLEDSEWQFHKDYKLYVADFKAKQMKDGRQIIEEYDTRLTIAAGGHLCIADEAWHKWPARGWSNTGGGILYYCSMVRRFGDDFWLQSQRFTDVDSILMDRMQDYWRCKNLGRMRWGRFKLPPIYSVSIFDHCPTPSSEPSHVQRFTLDKNGLAECYDTSGGVGVSGRVVADVGRKSTGLPLWLIPVVGVLVIAGVLYGGKLGIGWIRGALAGKKTPEPVKQSEAVKPAVAIQAGNMASQPVSPAVSGPVVTNEIYCVGYDFLDRGKPTVYFNDGTSATVPEVEQVATRFVTVSGHTFRVKSAPMPVYVPQPTPVYELPPAMPDKPINQADVTVIGQNYRAPHTQARLGGLASMR